jgi:hypothetical protein
MYHATHSDIENKLESSSPLDADVRGYDERYAQHNPDKEENHGIIG